ncbi:MAG: serine/threonine protein kinase [Calothrix sp. MO_192.B10]|nr:serine/threonine protein kinase [Calothrix sp. MO_192.B10]
MDKLHINSLIENIHKQLLPQIHIESIDPHNPVEVHHLPEPWQLLGQGNYAAVVYHPDYPDRVVKIYAPGRPGFDEELEVYKRLGSHPAFSECLYAQNSFLVLKRLYGTTLYDCMHFGIRIPPRVIRDIDAALDYARDRGLFPHDIHGRNVMMHQGKGLVVDVSDFLHMEGCYKWNHLKIAYYWLYLPIFYPLGIGVPYPVLDIVRKTYRQLSAWRK